MNIGLPLLLTIPWLALPVMVGLRARRSRSLDELPADAPPDAPFVSVIIPARNERRNIERCLRSVLASDYPAFEVIVVDDHSADGTGALARSIAASDLLGRARVIDAPELPHGWFGKQWACASGARAARGTLLLFTDADTWHAPDLLARAVNGLRAREADLLTIAGQQEMHSFWERVIQPAVFMGMLARFGGTEIVSNTRDPKHAIANGQYILVRRDTYDTMDGHALVRDKVAEDLALAQQWVRAGRRIVLYTAIRQFSTHMYDSLAELIGGWRKSMYVAGKTTVSDNRVMQALFPVVLITGPLFGLAPVVVLVAALAGALSAAWLVWAAVIVGLMLLCWAAAFVAIGENPLNAVLFPLGLVMLLYISATSVLRGHTVEWKSRSYVSR